MSFEPSAGTPSAPRPATGGFDRRHFLSAGALVVGGGAVTALTGGRAAAAQNPATEQAAAAAPGSAAGTPITAGWLYGPANQLPGVTGQRLASADPGVTLEPAVVPGTALTAMLANGDYPDPFHKRIVTDTIPDTLKDTDYWYRTEFELPALQAGQRFWLHFAGVNYLADVFLNGRQIGRMEGAFIRGDFDVTETVLATAPDGGRGYLAVKVGKLDFSEGPLLPSYASGVTRGGRNGGPTGVTLKNGPTFFCSAGWDWLPTIPDRNLGIWRPVSHRITGPIRIADVRVDPTLTGDLSSADIALDLTLDNAGEQTSAVISGTLTGPDGTAVEVSAELAVPAGTSTLRLGPEQVAVLRVTEPKLWWPNGYGDPNRYTLRLAVGSAGTTPNQQSDQHELRFGIRSVVCRAADDPTRQLQLIVNNVPIMVMGGNWGLDEALKRIPVERLRQQLRLHRDANLNLIRNWNGQNTSEELFDACDEYGILVWQDFFYSTEGPAAADVDRDVANIRDCIIRYRNHPSIALWCGGNEGSPPQPLVQALDALVAELDPKRACLTSSAGDTGADNYTGFASGGPYHWVTPASHFDRFRGRSSIRFHNEVGCYSIPTLETMRAMLPEPSWEKPDDYWADRDCNGNGGNGGMRGYLALTGQRYGQVRNLADFVRKSQLMNYECIRAIYEGHAAAMLAPATAAVPRPVTGVIMWMSHPAQPSMVWQMYSHDLDTHSAYAAVQRGCRRRNVIFDAATREVVLANHSHDPVAGTVRADIYTLAGRVHHTGTIGVPSVAGSSYARLGSLQEPIAALAAADEPVALVRLGFTPSGGGDPVSSFYWHDTAGSDRNYAAMDTMPSAAVQGTAVPAGTDGDDRLIRVELRNLSPAVAVMLHLQLFDSATGERVLPAFYDNNYCSIVPRETATVTIAVPAAAAAGRKLAVRLDGWNLDAEASRLRGGEVPLVINTDAQDVRGEVTFGRP